MHDMRSAQKRCEVFGSCFLMSVLFYDFCYLKNRKKSAKFAGALARKDDANLLLNRHNSPTDLQSPPLSDLHLKYEGHELRLKFQ